ncbi:hypothetical protein SAMN05192533_11772 [Mesobacillus persicus]|jgi:hypothetical protein|uniref:Uncharacterized protein n=1 Tax=Mesobacillus persicus TaxID=930146 RepID=A0A1H8IIH5_9BACI|nr:hypothetical protein [Mesobacillus persicus]SEN68640.1 hypothetical protein SAMN05192533_11772 [Mesobacillus persicus]
MIMVKGFFDELISIKYLLFGVIIYGYGVLLRNPILGYAQEHRLLINGWDLSLQLMNDMYLIVYFIVPLLMFFSVQSTHYQFSEQALIRIGSYKKWIYRSLKHFWKNASPLLFVWIFISLFMMIGLPFSSIWSPFSKSENFLNTLSGVASTFHHPLYTLIFQFFLLVIAASLLHTFIALNYLFVKNRNLILFACALIFFGGGVGFKLLPVQFSYLNPISYFSLVQITSSVTVPVACLLILIVIGITLFLMNLVDMSKMNFYLLIKQFGPKIIYLILCLSGILSNANSIRSSDATIWDLLLLSFSGTGATGFSYSSYFFYCIVFFGFLYLVSLFLVNEIELMGPYKLIRYRSLYRWFWSWFKRLIVTVILFIFGLSFIILTIGFIVGLKTNLYTTMLSVPIDDLLTHFLMNSFLQLTFYILAVFILIWSSKESSYVLILISVFMVLMLPGLNSFGLNPIGLNSFLSLIDHSIIYISSFLTFMIIASLLIINYLFKKSLKI